MTFNNYGTFTKADDSVTILAGPFNNFDGSSAGVQQGTLRLTGGGQATRSSLGNAFTVQQGILDFSDGVYTFNATLELMRRTEPSCAAAPP